MEFIARQPIFDRQRKLAASELLFRNSEENRCCVPDLNVASRQMMATAMLVGLRMRDCLDLVIAYERGNWRCAIDTAKAGGFRCPSLAEKYLEAVKWRQSLLQD
jgi:c-di-GMP-related signal transduction protein